MALRSSCKALFKWQPLALIMPEGLLLLLQLFPLEEQEQHIRTKVCTTSCNFQCSQRYRYEYEP